MSDQVTRRRGLVELTATAVEVDRVMTICNACRYCEGLCAVFPAMERRRVFDGGDLDFLANLCHNCGACLYDCQYAPPHEFDVGVPSRLAALRRESWNRHAWPGPVHRLLGSGRWATVAAVVVAIVAFVVAVAATMGDSFTEAHTGEGAFYEVVPHGVIVAVFLAGLGYGVVALAVSVRRFWRAIGGERLRWAHLSGAAVSASTLEYLDGGGVGCMNEDEHPTDRRRAFHHLTYYGFALCLASTTLAAVLESGFGQHAPFALWHPVVVMGTLGGLGLVVGPLGLWWSKLRRAPQLGDPDSRPIEVAFLALLLALALTGLAVLVLRSTGAMPALLAVHLGVVMAFFVTLPHTKFVHGAYRYAALVRDRQERAV